MITFFRSKFAPPNFIFNCQNFLRPKQWTSSPRKDLALFLSKETSPGGAVVSLYGRHFVEMNDVTADELQLILKHATELKTKQKRGEPHRILEGKTLAMIFEKQSTRTRVSFETGMFQLGGHALFLGSHDLQVGRGETVEDTARVLSGFVDCIMARTYAHATVTGLAKYSKVPVINGLSDYEHPCQILADLLTIQEDKTALRGLKLTYVGDGNNVANSLIIGCVKAGMSISLACPEGYWPDSTIVQKSKQEAAKQSQTVEVTTDPSAAVKDADVLYTDVWVSMGQDEETEKRLKVFKPYQINSALVAKAKEDCIVLHCLPAHYGQEITKDVVDGKHSRIFEEAENRLHTQKALLSLLLSKESQTLSASRKN